MTERNNATYWERICGDARAFGALARVTCYAWLRLVRQFALCVWMTLRLAGRTVYWTARLAWPVPTAIDETMRRRRWRHRTGLAVPVGDLLVVVGGLALVAGRYL